MLVYCRAREVIKRRAPSDFRGFCARHIQTMTDNSYRAAGGKATARVDAKSHKTAQLR